ncbi:MAG: hypothetical protein R3251_01160 [Candidatus Spechtbacterales bacterium]|nr:hypothetical protein [Candidatus Spechtbacterales bacterium]
MATDKQGRQELTELDGIIILDHLFFRKSNDSAIQMLREAIKTQKKEADNG